MTKRCDNCKFFKEENCITMCTHKAHWGYVPTFTSCPDHEFIEKPSTPFDGIKFYLAGADTGELRVKYICRDCGKEMDTPYTWQFCFPTRYPNQPTLSTSGFRFLCEECTNRKDTK